MYEDEYAQQPLIPASADDFEPTPSQSEKQWHLLLKDFGIPQEVQARFYALINHHLALGKIQTQEDLTRLEIETEDIIRMDGCDDAAPDLSPAEKQQIKFFIKWLMRKSYEGGTATERVLLVTQFRNINQKSEEISSVPKSDGGVLSGFFGRR